MKAPLPPRTSRRRRGTKPSQNGTAAPAESAQQDEAPKKEADAPEAQPASNGARELNSEGSEPASGETKDAEPEASRSPEVENHAADVNEEPVARDDGPSHPEEPSPAANGVAEPASPLIESSAPGESSSVPKEEVAVQDSPADKAEEASAPVENNSVPKEEAPEPTNTAPEEDNSAHKEESPMETSTSPEQTSSTPEEGFSTPKEETSAPAEESHVPKEDSSAPNENVSAHEEEGSAPKETSTVLEESNSTAKEVGSAPEEPSCRATAAESGDKEVADAGASEQKPVSAHNEPADVDIKEEPATGQESKPVSADVEETPKSSSGDQETSTQPQHDEHADQAKSSSQNEGIPESTDPKPASEDEVADGSFANAHEDAPSAQTSSEVPHSEGLESQPGDRAVQDEAVHDQETSQAPVHPEEEASSHPEESHDAPKEANASESHPEDSPAKDEPVHDREVNEGPSHEEDTSSKPEESGGVVQALRGTISSILPSILTGSGSNTADDNQKEESLAQDEAAHQDETREIQSHSEEKTSSAPEETSHAEGEKAAGENDLGIAKGGEAEEYLDMPKPHAESHEEKDAPSSPKHENSVDDSARDTEAPHDLHQTSEDSAKPVHDEQAAATPDQSRSLDETPNNAQPAPAVPEEKEKSGVQSREVEDHSAETNQSSHETSDARKEEHQPEEAISQEPEETQPREDLPASSETGLNRSSEPQPDIHVEEPEQVLEGAGKGQSPRQGGDHQDHGDLQAEETSDLSGDKPIPETATHSVDDADDSEKNDNKRPDEASTATDALPQHHQEAKSVPPSDAKDTSTDDNAQLPDHHAEVSSAAPSVSKDISVHQADEEPPSGHAVPNGAQDTVEQSGEKPDPAHLDHDAGLGQQEGPRDLDVTGHGNIEEHHDESTAVPQGEEARSVEDRDVSSKPDAGSAAPVPSESREVEADIAPQSTQEEVSAHKSPEHESASVDSQNQPSRDFPSVSVSVEEVEPEVSSHQTDASPPHVQQEAPASNGQSHGDTGAAEEPSRPTIHTEKVHDDPDEGLFAVPPTPRSEVDQIKPRSLDAVSAGRGSPDQAEDRTGPTSSFEPHESRSSPEVGSSGHDHDAGNEQAHPVNAPTEDVHAEHSPLEQHEVSGDNQAPHGDQNVQADGPHSPEPIDAGHDEASAQPQPSAAHDELQGPSSLDSTDKSAGQSHEQAEHQSDDHSMMHAEEPQEHGVSGEAGSAAEPTAHSTQAHDLEDEDRHHDPLSSQDESNDDHFEDAEPQHVDAAKSSAQAFDSEAKSAQGEDYRTDQKEGQDGSYFAADDPSHETSYGHETPHYEEPAHSLHGADHPVATSGSVANGSQQTNFAHDDVHAAGESEAIHSPVHAASFEEEHQHARADTPTQFRQSPGHSPEENAHTVQGTDDLFDYDDDDDSDSNFGEAFATPSERVVYQASGDSNNVSLGGNHSSTSLGRFALESPTSYGHRSTGSRGSFSSARETTPIRTTDGSYLGGTNIVRADWAAEHEDELRSPSRPTASFEQSTYDTPDISPFALRNTPMDPAEARGLSSSRWNAERPGTPPSSTRQAAPTPLSLHQTPTYDSGRSRSSTGPSRAEQTPEQPSEADFDIDDFSVPRDVTNVPWHARNDSVPMSLHSQTTLSSDQSSPIHSSLAADKHEPVIRDSWPAPVPGTQQYLTGFGRPRGDSSLSSAGEYDPSKADASHGTANKNMYNPFSQRTRAESSVSATPSQKSTSNSPNRGSSLFQKMRNVFESGGNNNNEAPAPSPGRVRPVSAFMSSSPHRGSMETPRPGSGFDNDERRASYEATSPNDERSPFLRSSGLPWSRNEGIN